MNRRTLVLLSILAVLMLVSAFVWWPSATAPESGVAVPAFQQSEVQQSVRDRPLRTN